MPLTSKNRCTISKGLFILLFFTSLGSPLQADEFHYNNMLIGNRASGLAGAYVSISDDPSGLYYNPAGVVYSSATNISANMNAFNISRTEYKNALGGKSWIRTSSALVPNFFGITQPLGPGTLGFSYAVTESLLEDQDQTFYDIPATGTQFNINFNNQDNTSNIGPSYALPVSDKLSIGLTLYGTIRRQEKIFNQSFDFPNEQIIVNESTGETTDVNHFHIENMYITLSEYGIQPIFGIMYSPFSDVSFGATISKLFLLNSSYDDQFTVASTFCDDATKNFRCDNAHFLRTTTQSALKRKTPWQINLGATWFVNSRLLLTGSAWIYEAINQTNKPLINIASGIEYYLTEKFAVRLGAYTNMANTPELKENANNFYNEHINIFGGTISLSHFSRTSTISFGAAGSYGVGQAQVLDTSTSIQEVEYRGLSLFISASNAY